MTELSLNILDIACNSTRAGASSVKISVLIETERDLLTVVIGDDGKGMSEDFIAKVADPFSTTRTTRKVGLGIPFYKMAAEMSGGDFKIESRLGRGTVVTATFKLSHIDRPPLGDLASTVTTLIGGSPQTDFVLDYNFDGENYVFDTKEVKDALGENDLTDITVLNYLSEMIKENINSVNKGELL